MIRAKLAASFARPLVRSLAIRVIAVGEAFEFEVAGVALLAAQATCTGAPLLPRAGCLA